MQKEKVVITFKHSNTEEQIYLLYNSISYVLAHLLLRIVYLWYTKYPHNALSISPRTLRQYIINMITIHTEIAITIFRTTLCPGNS